MSELFQTGHGRVFLQLFGANPQNEMEYQGLARLSGFSKSEGDVTRVQGPSDLAYDEFEDLDEVRGEGSLPTTSMIARFGLVNPILTANCPFHVQVHYGKCEDPQDQNTGWTKILGYQRARFTQRAGDEQSALSESDRAPILLTGDITARRMWSINQIALSEKADAEAVVEVIDVFIGDFISCGDCGYQSGGEERMYAITTGFTTGSPGLPAELLVAEDGGATWAQYDITTLGADENPSAGAKVGQQIVVVSNVSNSMHIAEMSDYSTWAEVGTGFEVTGEPNAIFSIGASRTWIVGDLGYVYFTNTPDDGVSVQDAGVATNEHLMCIHGADIFNLIAGGAAGALIVTSDGGKNWYAATSSPTVQTINAVWMRSPYVWIVLDNGGRMYYTKDAGTSWTEKLYPLSGDGVMYDISFSREPGSPYGVLTATDGSNGFIFRTIDGGNSWYQLPDVAAATPTNVRLNSIAAGLTGNVLIAGGLKAAGADGIVIIGSGVES